MRAPQRAWVYCHRSSVGPRVLLRPSGRCQAARPSGPALQRIYADLTLPKNDDPPLALDGFFLIFRCTHCAHATFQPIEKLELSLQSIMGATENFNLCKFNSLILIFSSRSPRYRIRAIPLRSLRYIAQACTTFNRKNFASWRKLSRRAARNDRLRSHAHRAWPIDKGWNCPSRQYRRQRNLLARSWRALRVRVWSLDQCMGVAIRDRRTQRARIKRPFSTA